jgi:hypothetical protein
MSTPPPPKVIRCYTEISRNNKPQSRDSVRPLLAQIVCVCDTTALDYQTSSCPEYGALSARVSCHIDVLDCKPEKVRPRETCLLKCNAVYSV